MGDADGVLLVNASSASVEGAATGMVLSSDGLALTNYHVVEGSSEVTVTVADTGEIYTASVIGHDAGQDVAVLQLQGATGLETVAVDQDGTALGQDVAAIGNAWGQGYLTAVSGDVTGFNQSVAVESATGAKVLTGMIATDADVVTGYSGGPLVDTEGEVVGLSTAATVGSTTEEVNGFAIPISGALDIADQVVAGAGTDTVQVGAPATLGVTTTTDPSGSGARVLEMGAASAAASAGILPDDTITAVDGTAVQDSAGLTAVIDAHEPGDAITVEWVDAAGVRYVATVTLQANTVN